VPAPTKFNNIIADKLLRVLSSGVHRDVAARAVGITDRTLRNWMRKGEGGDPLFRQFAEDVKQVEAKAEVGHVANITLASRNDWRASAWYLERKADTRWTRVDKHEVSGREGQPLGVVILPPEEAPEPSVLVSKPLQLVDASDDDEQDTAGSLETEPGPAD
jgi:hypothetical protein